METKEEILVRLRAVNKTVLKPILRETLEYRKTYDVPVIDADMVSRTIVIVTLNEGEEFEAAEECLCPSLDEPHPWPGIVYSVVDTAIQDGKFKKAVVTEINNEQEFAIVTVYKTGLFPTLLTKIGKEQKFIYDDGKAVVIVAYSGE